jgi:ABC-2 type transport system permease protein
MHVRVALATELAYRSNFWMYLLTTVITLATTLAGLGLVYGHVDSLNGWTSNELLVVIGTFFALGAVVNGVVHSSMAQLVADIRQGDFDYRLLKPVDSQLVAIAQQPDPWKLFDLLVGLVLVIIGMARSGSDLSAGQLAERIGAAAGMFACACVIVIAFWTLLASITFWTIQGEGILWALDDMYDHLRWPISIFPTGLRIALTTIFPAGLAVTVPAEALTGRLDAASILAALGMAALLAALARATWNVAVRRYEGASA